MSNTLASLPFSHLDDNNFRLTLYEMKNGPISFDSERLDSLKFNPLLSISYRNFSLCKDRDPNLIVTCNSTIIVNIIQKVALIIA